MPRSKSILLVTMLSLSDSGVASASSAFVFLRLYDQTRSTYVVDFSHVDGAFAQSGVLQAGNYSFLFRASSAGQEFSNKLADAWTVGQFDLTLSAAPATFTTAQSASAAANVRGTTDLVLQERTNSAGAFDRSYLATRANGNDLGVGAVAVSQLISSDSFSTDFSTRGHSVGVASSGSGAAGGDWNFTVNSPLTYSILGSVAAGTWTHDLTDPTPPSPPSNGPGSSQHLPTLPISGTPVSGNPSDGNRIVWGFYNEDGQWIDPPLTSGYDFEMTGDSLFTRIASLPVGIDGDDQMAVSVDGIVLGSFAGGSSVDFVQLLGHGVTSFQVSGIDPAVDASNPMAFPIQLNFNTDFASFNMTSVPEPGTAALVLLGLTGVLFLQRRSQRN